MKLTIWGAARTVTGSQHLLETDHSRILLDCGLYQGRRADSYTVNQNLPFDARRIDAVALSHAHIDHSGNIPNLTKSGFSGHIYCTHATRDLCAAMLRDSAMIQQEDARFLNKRRVLDDNLPLVEPIYSLEDAEDALSTFASYDYDKPIRLTTDVQARFGDAGHMLGSAWILIDAQEEGRSVRLCFSGDLGRFGLPILRDPRPMPEADYLIIESTYGDRLHPPASDALPELRQAIADAVQRGGKVVIPAFAVGRTQEIVHGLHQLMLAGELPDVPIYVDSPLAVNVTEVFRHHPECYDRETGRMLLESTHGDVFGFRRLSYVRDVEASKALNDLRSPAVIISASGMCENGRILHHLRHSIEDPKNMILFVSFQAENTLGRRILDGAHRVRILGEEFRVRAEVRRIEAYSGHADRDELLAWVKPQAACLRGVFVVHGEEDAALALAEGIRNLGVRSVHVPARGDSFEL
ncbi:MAG: MBL fold metallo-hydrolase [Anaerolineae bacterium]|nr:MBL fold metallo-hydrolase [Thermoflexales bacterium]MDW8407393.1 MBL fold metallo-hydrolase [Anaerolineae bacterium]